MDVIWTISFNKKTAVKPYWSARRELITAHGILLKSTRVVVPSAMKLQVLDKIHEGHQGIVKCRERAKTSVWWPGLSREVYLVVEYVFLTLYRGGCYAKDHQIA